MSPRTKELAGTISLPDPPAETPRNLWEPAQSERSPPCLVTLCPAHAPALPSPEDRPPGPGLGSFLGQSGRPPPTVDWTLPALYPSLPCSSADLPLHPGLPPGVFLVHRRSPVAADQQGPCWYQELRPRALLSISPSNVPWAQAHPNQCHKPGSEQAIPQEPSTTPK